MPMGANGRRNDGSIRPVEWRRNGTKHAVLHQRLGHINRTLHADIEKPTTLEKTFNNLHKINSFVRIHYPTGRRHLVRHQPSPPSCRRSRPRDRRDRRSRPWSRPRRTLSLPAASLVVSTISSTFSSKSAIAKFRNAHQTKMANVDSNIQHRHVTLKKHCT